ncbi:uncharacterized protein K02A2.6-like [Wyeomyia smithii]|uniref:uncharacterized protein K02A2.6-like n=1 Tax=Wyeomyia smithii TaxID=174621 RepID=UPI002467E776|nr:uncharacterized protein K02A2.6-like [Wyeomyia smithii]
MENDQTHDVDPSRFPPQQQQMDTSQGTLGQPVRQQQFIPTSSEQQRFSHPVQQHAAPVSVNSVEGLLAAVVQMLQNHDVQQPQHQMQQQQLQVQQQQWQQQNEKRQQDFFQSIASSIRVNVPPNPEQILDSLASNIKEFRYDADNIVTFGAWYSRYDDLFAKDAARLEDEAKVRLLLRKLGLAEHERYVSFILPKLPKDYSFDETVEKLKNLFGAKESVISRRYRYLQIARNQSEDHIAYACRVNKSCVEFELGKLSEEQFKCLVYVCGLKAKSDAEIRARLLSKIEERTDVTLEQLSEECQRLHNLKHDNAMIERATSFDQIHTVKQNFERHRFRKRNADFSKASTSGIKRLPQTPCWLCGSMHYIRDCTFKKHKCNECGQFGHREGYCGSAIKSRKSTRQRGKASVHSKLVVVNVCSVHKRRRFVSVGLGGTNVRLQLDTASDITVISRNTWRKVGSPALVPATVNAKAASGDVIPMDGEFCASMTVAGSTRKAVIRVSQLQLNLLGSDMFDSFQLGSVPIDSICNQISAALPSVSILKSKFPAVFSDTPGLCTKVKVKFTLKADYTPVFRLKRPVAYAMCAIVDEELDRLQRAGIITPIEYSEWAAPIVVVRKASGAIRICGDYSTGLNDALEPHQYPLPLPQDIFAKLAKCKVFSQIDLSDAFLQVEVDERSRELLTINTHRGLYRYNRLTPGVKAAPGAFQQLIDTMLAGLSCTSGYLDDISQ